MVDSPHCLTSSETNKQELTLKPKGQSKLRNLFNAFLCTSVLVIWDRSVHYSFTPGYKALIPVNQYPLLAISLLLLINISFLFWIIGLFQKSFWLIDPFWTWIPFMIVQYYSFHPNAEFSSHYWTMLGILGLWSLRLTHNYFRRENWQFGVREDWRYSQLAIDCGRHWWWISFWAVGVLQQILLTGLTLPFYSILFTKPLPPWTVLSTLAVLLCLLGIFIGFVADNQLHSYMSCGIDRPVVLKSGFWKFSRHPNYFGEQLFWWSLSIFSMQCGHCWAVIGPLLNTLVLAETTRLTENRMLNKSSRRAAYRKYQKTTSVWIPWFSVWKED